MSKIIIDPRNFSQKDQKRFGTMVKFYLQPAQLHPRLRNKIIQLLIVKSKEKTSSC
jgi:hypothetical protein